MGVGASLTKDDCTLERSKRGEEGGGTTHLLTEARSARLHALNRRRDCLDYFRGRLQLRVKFLADALEHLFI